MNIRILAMTLAAALLLQLPVAAKAEPARFLMEPPLLVADAPIAITLTGLPPRTEILVRAERIVHASLIDGKKHLFRSEAWFQSDAQGRINLATAAARRGTYRGVDLHGLFWSMAVTDEPVGQQDKTGVVRLKAFVGDKVAAEADLTIASASTSVEVEQLKEFSGAILAKPKSAKPALPVLILLGGGEGGSGAARDQAPKLAALGFAVLGLPYYSPAEQPGGPRELPDLPADFANIDILQLNKVRHWLRGRSDIDANRIGLFGASKGAEFALLAASHLDWVKAVVAVTPSDVVWEGYGWNTAPGSAPSFSLGGKPLPFVPYKGFIEEYMRFGTGEPVHLRRPHDLGRAAHPDAAVHARIPVERFKGRLLLLAGQDDQLWNSAAMAQNIAERRSQAGLPTELLVYSDAGHYLIGDGWSPTTHYNAGLKQSGGTPSGTAAAQIDARPRIAAFLHSAL